MAAGTIAERQRRLIDGVDAKAVVAAQRGWRLDRIIAGLVGAPVVLGDGDGKFMEAGLRLVPAAARQRQLRLD